MLATLLDLIKSELSYTPDLYSQNKMEGQQIPYLMRSQFREKLENVSLYSTGSYHNNSSYTILNIIMNYFLMEHAGSQPSNKYFIRQ